MSYLISDKHSAHLETLELDGCSVVRVPGRFASCYVITSPAGCCVVDPGSTTVLAGIDTLVARHGPVHAYLLTHGHFDHIAALEHALQRWPAPVHAGPLLKAFLQGELALPYPRYGGPLVLAANWLRQGLPLPPLRDIAPTLRLARGSYRCSGQLAAAVAHTAELDCLPGWSSLVYSGHSQEDVCLWHRARGVLICGDLVANLRGGEWNQVLTDPIAYAYTRQALRRLPAQALLCGHGPMLTGPRPWQNLRG